MPMLTFLVQEHILVKFLLEDEDLVLVDEVDVCPRECVRTKAS